ncbi:hypothetical protein [Bacillus massiliigorillae]|uniref:hypothetical protein n=1 Tax=Bacillus massiliigorillae TaxID=1243664 RepID=UPI0012B566D6|nr:hypothetical protein [Bacillus massiliigorillae]
MNTNISVVKVCELRMLLRIFWSLNASISGLLLGFSLFNLLFIGYNNQVWAGILVFSLIYTAVCVVTFRKYAKKGLLFKGNNTKA